MGVYINTVYLPVEGNVVYRIKETERSNTVRESERDMKIWSNLKYHIWRNIKNGHHYMYDTATVHFCKDPHVRSHEAQAEEL